MQADKFAVHAVARMAILPFCFIFCNNIILLVISQEARKYNRISTSVNTHDRAQYPVGDLIDFMSLGIITLPQSVNISSGDHAVFNCTAIATDITWRINGDNFNADFISEGFEELPLIAMQNLRMRQLRVLGSPDSDNASIVCVVVLQVSLQKIVGNTSAPVILLVQGQ